MSKELRLDNPTLVGWEFASEERLATRNALYRRLIEGDHAEDVLFEAVRERAPKDVLEVGAGTGELAQRLRDELDAAVTALDSSERMVELTRARGIDAVVGDVQTLPFGDAAFDCVVAGWVLYHVADRDRAIRECARVLRPRGRFVVATLADENLYDLWNALGHQEERQLSFSSANGAEQLAPYFPRIEVREARGLVVFRSPEEMRRYAAADITRAHLAANVPATLEAPFAARVHHTIFVADKA